jgi:hypothetical protein
MLENNMSSYDNLFDCPNFKDVTVLNGLTAQLCSQHKKHKEPKLKPKSKPIHSFVYMNRRHVLCDDRTFDHNNFKLRISFNGKFKIIMGINNIINYIKPLNMAIEDKTMMERLLLEGVM